MSAISGIYHLHGQPIDPYLLKTMTECSKHRGPDGCSIWHEGPVGFGHCSLHTTPESLYEHLPSANKKGTVVITADARIDNRDELIREFSHEQRSIPDSDLILRTYDQWGESCVDHLIGDFSFVIWDKSKNRLFCARDHLGNKPFFYCTSGETFSFASEIKSLLTLPWVKREVNENQVARYLASAYDRPDFTFYQSLSRLPAAHTLIVSANDFNIQRYWALNPAHEIQFETDAEYEKAFRDIFLEAVKCRLRSSSPIGVLLSGGIDSSSVAAAASSLTGREGMGKPGGPYPDIHTFSSICKNVQECDESLFIHDVISSGHFIAHKVNIDEISPLIDLDQRVLDASEAPDDKNMFIIWPLYKEAHKLGIRVLIDGFFGDTAISYGAGSLSDLFRGGKFRKVIREVNRISRKTGSPRWRIFWNQVLFRSMPRRFRAGWPKKRNYPRFFLRDLNFLNQNIPQYNEIRDILQLRQEAQWLMKTARDLHYLDISWEARQHDFESLEIAAGSLGIEIRHPFSDRRLVEFCLALPPGQKIREGYNRAILRTALCPFVPETIMGRVKKADLDLVFFENLRSHETLHLGETLFSRPYLIEEFVNIHRLKKAYYEFLEGRNEHSGFLWKAAALMKWLQQEENFTHNERAKMK